GPPPARTTSPACSGAPRTRTRRRRNSARRSRWTRSTPTPRSSCASWRRGKASTRRRERTRKVECCRACSGAGSLDTPRARVALCRTVRGDTRLAGLPVLVMNADRAQATRAAALQGGADDFLVKPLLIKELVARIRVLLAHREQARNNERGAAAALTGSVGDLGLVDLFTSLENWQKTATVLCEAGDGRSARVWVRDGQVVDAEVDPV